MRKALLAAKHPAFSSSLVMLIGNNTGNLMVFIYTFIVGRALGPSLYADLAVVLSFITFFASTLTNFSLVVTKYISTAKTTKDLSSALGWFSEMSGYLTIGLFLVSLIFTNSISTFLRIPTKLALLIPFALGFSVILITLKAYLQGLMRFRGYIAEINLENLSRLVFALLLLILGFSVFGAALAVVVSLVLGIFVSYFFLRDKNIFAKSKAFRSKNSVFGYALPVLIFSIASTSFLTMDVILAKHFLPSHEAGLFASLSTLGKIVLYGVVPISSALFPMIAQRHSKGETISKYFGLGILMIVGFSMSVLFVYWFMPKLVITILYGREYLEGAKHLMWFGFFAAFYSYSTALLSFYLSINRTRTVTFMVFFALLQIIGIYFFHDTIESIVKVSLACSVLLFISLVIYFVYAAKAIYYSEK